MSHIQYESHLTLSYIHCLTPIDIQCRWGFDFFLLELGSCVTLRNSERATLSHRKQWGHGPMAMEPSSANSTFHVRNRYEPMREGADHYTFGKRLSKRNIGYLKSSEIHSFPCYSTHFAALPCYLIPCCAHLHGLAWLTRDRERHWKTLVIFVKVASSLGSPMAWPLVPIS